MGRNCCIRRLPLVPRYVAMTFSEPGNYVIRVRANDASGVSNAGHAQCCWSNGFIKVVVTK